MTIIIFMLEYLICHSTIANMFLSNDPSLRCRMLWPDLIEDFLRLKAGDKGSDTYSAYKRTAESFRNHVDLNHGSPTSFPEITPDDVSSFVHAEINPQHSKLREKRLEALDKNKTSSSPAAKTVSQRLAILSGLFNIAIYYDKEITNHAQNLRSIMGRKMKESTKKSNHGIEQRNKALNVKERKDFYEKLTELAFKEPAFPKDSKRYKHALSIKPAIIARNELLFYLFEATGVRVSGMMNLTLHKLDVDKMQMEIIEKGNKPRLTPILPQSISHDEMHERLVDWIDIHRLKMIGDKNHSFLWVNNHGAPMKKWLPQLICREAMEAVDLHKPYFGPHLLRHTFATDKLDAGDSPRDVAMVMGHADMQTISTYDSGEAQAAMDRMRERLCQNESSG